MNILIIAYYYPPVNSGGTMRPVQMGKHLPLLGHNISILTHSYKKDSVEPGNPQILRFRDISYNRDRVGICKKMQWALLRGFTEILNKCGKYHSIYSWWKNRVIRNCEKIIEHTKPDAILATYPPVETLEIGVYLSKKYNIPLISDFRDGLIFEPIETKRMSQYKCIREKYLQIEKEAISSSSAVTSIASPITGYYKETYRVPFAEVISNAFDPNDLKDLPGDVAFDSSHFNIVFTGRFSLSEESNIVDYFFHALRSILETKDPTQAFNIRVHLVGEYRADELAKLSDLIEKNIVVLHGFVERKRALAFQKAADLLLIITLPDRSSSTSAKLFEYLFTGKPILSLTHKTVLEDIINETHTGWNVHPHQTEAIADLLWKIVSDPVFYSSLKPDWEKIEEYSITTQMKRLDRLLFTITSHSDKIKEAKE